MRTRTRNMLHHLGLFFELTCKIGSCAVLEWDGSRAGCAMSGLKNKSIAQRSARDRERSQCLLRVKQKRFRSHCDVVPPLHDAAARMDTSWDMDVVTWMFSQRQALQHTTAHKECP